MARKKRGRIAESEIPYKCYCTEQMMMGLY